MAAVAQSLFGNLNLSSDLIAGLAESGFGLDRGVAHRASFSRIF